jgi:hypothetical protein
MPGGPGDFPLPASLDALLPLSGPAACLGAPVVPPQLCNTLPRASLDVPAGCSRHGCRCFHCSPPMAERLRRRILQASRVVRASVLTLKGNTAGTPKGPLYGVKATGRSERGEIPGLVRIKRSKDPPRNREKSPGPPGISDQRLNHKSRNRGTCLIRTQEVNYHYNIVVKSLMKGEDHYAI